MAVLVGGIMTMLGFRRGGPKAVWWSHGYKVIGPVETTSRDSLGTTTRDGTVIVTWSDLGADTQEALDIAWKHLPDLEPGFRRASFAASVSLATIDDRGRERNGTATIQYRDIAYTSNA